MAEYLTKDEFNALREMVPHRVTYKKGIDYSYDVISDQYGDEIAFAVYKDGVCQSCVLLEQRLRARIAKAREADFANLIEIIKFMYGRKWVYVNNQGYVWIRRESEVAKIERFDLVRIALML